MVIARRLPRTLAAGLMALVAACELVVGIKDRPLQGGSDAFVPEDGTLASEDATNDSTVGSDAPEEVSNPGEEPVAETGPDAAEMLDVILAPDRGPCAFASPPPRPTVEDGTQDLVLQLAVRTVDLGIRLNPEAGLPPPRVGFNLDGLQTCPDLPCSMRSGVAPVCDARCGVDNAATPLFQTFAQLTNGRFNQDAFNTELAAGTFGLILRIRNYNGGANDAQVEVAVYDSNGTMGGARPLWDGTDVWTLDSSGVLAQSGVDANPAYIQIDAYVADHMLVAQIDHLPIRLYGGSVLGTLIFQTFGGTFIVGTLTPDRPGTFRIDDGMLAGRWPTKNISSGLEAVPDPVLDGGYLCPSSTSSYPIIARIICNKADITAELRTQNPATTCDAVSFGNGFTAVPGLMGSVTSRGAAPTTCPNAGPENCEY
jgi:hypothetical protein